MDKQEQYRTNHGNGGVEIDAVICIMKKTTLSKQKNH